jgi:hypothetical protein
MKSWKLGLAVALLATAQFATAQQQKYYTGDGGKGIRLAVLEPVGKGLAADEQWMLSLVQGSISWDFLLTWRRLSLPTLTKLKI